MPISQNTKKTLIETTNTINRASCEATKAISRQVAFTFIGLGKKKVARPHTMRLGYQPPYENINLASRHAPLHLRENHSQMQELRVKPAIGASHRPLSLSNHHLPLSRLPLR